MMEAVAQGGPAPAPPRPLGPQTRLSPAEVWSLSKGGYRCRPGEFPLVARASEAHRGGGQGAFGKGEQ